MRKEEKRKNETLQWLRQFVLTIFMTYHSINDAWMFTEQDSEIVVPFATWSSEGPTILALGTVLWREKSKQAACSLKCQRVSKKNSTTLFMIHTAKPSREKFIGFASSEKSSHFRPVYLIESFCECSRCSLLRQTWSRQSWASLSSHCHEVFAYQFVYHVNHLGLSSPSERYKSVWKEWLKLGLVTW